MVKLSICIPYYETYELTKKLLETLIPQLTNETELILVDDGCIEMRLDEFKKENVIIKHTTENKGGATTSNICVDLAKGKYVALIDSDDMVSSDYVDTLLGAINEHNEDLMYMDWQDMNTGVIVRRPNNYAPWKCIYKRDKIPRFRDGWLYSFDVPFQEDVDKLNLSKYYIGKVLYYYNSNRPGNLTTIKEKIIKNRNMKYVILANSNDKKLNIPRQLVEINGEPLIKRTIRLLKENGVENIIITARDKRFDNLGATRYEPINSDYDYATEKGYWLNAFPKELLNEPVCFIWGDVYFSENAIKTIVETDTDDMLFFCSFENKDPRYIKKWDEPFAYKVIDYETFKKHIDIVKKAKDDGKCLREPIVWELYRSIHGLDITVHQMTDGYVAINDESCDVDNEKDLRLIKEKVE